MLSFFRFTTPLYKNTGSVARDHLASERTFLAWMRTGLGFVALGIAIERFSQLDLSELLPDHLQRRPRDRDALRHRDADKEQSQVLVGVLLGLGSGSIVYGAARYFANMKHLERGEFKPAYHGAAVMAAAVAGLAGGVYGAALRRRRAERAEMRD
ncbi:hypothetical protein F4780DRAFT_359540 [Xylariomycetidae sp. FL0641]|nr:hypothetical protein F4780DRAFT_359540 [Xylariomycetidae sp. FL0641]